MTRSASLILIGFLSATILLFAFAGIRTPARLIHLQLELSLLLAHLCLLPAVLYATDLCKTLFILIHFFYTAAFSFMFLEALHLFWLVGKVAQT